jgi:hypothetical protein
VGRGQPERHTRPGQPGHRATRLGVGRYEITFDRNVAGCAYIATTRNAYSQALGVFTAGGHLSANGVYIETKNPGGGLQDGVPFHLALICPGTATSRFAVVKAGGLTQRASTGTTSSRPSTGNYQIANNLNVSACAAVATRGSVNTAVPYSPATVEIVPGANSQSFGVQVRQLLFFGGALANQAFHAAVIS